MTQLLGYYYQRTTTGENTQAGRHNEENMGLTTHALLKDATHLMLKIPTHPRGKRKPTSRPMYHCALTPLHSQIGTDSHPIVRAPQKSTPRVTNKDAV